MMPLTGWLAGRFGIKYIFLVSVIGFTLASALCGAATSLGELVLFRALQGVAGAGLSPLSQAMLLQINPPERHGRAMAVFSTGTILGPIMGPALGGWLTYEYSWRWVFYINLPVGVLCTLGTLIFIRQTRHVHREPFDFVGFLTLTLDRPKVIIFTAYKKGGSPATAARASMTARRFTYRGGLRNGG